MDLNFYLNSALPIFVILLAIINPKLLKTRNLSNTPIILKVFSLFLIILSICKTTTITDYQNGLFELSGQEEGLIKKYPFLFIFINLPLSGELKLILISLTATLVLSLSIFKFQKFYKFNIITFSILVYAVYTLMTFHYRQFLSFSFLSAYIVLIFDPKKNWLSKIAIIILGLLILLTHPIYIISILFVPMTFVFVRSNYYKMLAKDLVIKYGSTKLIKFSRIISFVIISPLVAVLLILPFYQFFLNNIFSAYDAYSFNWYSDGVIRNRATYFSLIIRFLFFVPYINNLNNLGLKNKFEYRYSTISLYVAIFITLSIFIIQNKSGLASIERLTSIIFPFLIFDPYATNLEKTFKSIFKASTTFFAIFIIFIIYYKTLNYIDLYNLRLLS